LAICLAPHEGPPSTVSSISYATTISHIALGTAYRHGPRLVLRSGAALGTGTCGRLGLRDHRSSGLLPSFARRRPGVEVGGNGSARRMEDGAVLVPTGAAVGPCRGTCCQHGLRVCDFLIRWTEACVQGCNLVRTHAKTTLEARLASSDGRRQSVVVTGNEPTRGGAPPCTNGLDPHGVGYNDEPLHKVGHEMQVSG